MRHAMIAGVVAFGLAGIMGPGIAAAEGPKSAASASRPEQASHEDAAATSRLRAQVSYDDARRMRNSGIVFISLGSGAMSVGGLLLYARRHDVYGGFDIIGGGP